MIAPRIPRQVGQLAPSVLAIFLIVTPGLAGDDSNEAWAALVKGGHVAVIRHGNAPPGYGGDPPGFRFDDCKTQRNLDDMGREQARALGEAFRKHGVRVDRIMASPVCRCQETGQLMAVGSVETSWDLLPDRGPTPVRFLALKESRMLRHIQMHQPAPAVGQHHEHEQDSKRRRGHREEIQRDEILGVVRQKRAPRLRRRPPRSEHVLRNRRLGYRYAELQQLTVDSRRAPQ
jgi:hypothetical protein